MNFKASMLCAALVGVPTIATGQVDEVPDLPATAMMFAECFWRESGAYGMLDEHLNAIDIAFDVGRDAPEVQPLLSFIENVAIPSCFVFATGFNENPEDMGKAIFFVSKKVANNKSRYMSDTAKANTREEVDPPTPEKLASQVAECFWKEAGKVEMIEILLSSMKGSPDADAQKKISSFLESEGASSCENVLEGHDASKVEPLLVGAMKATAEKVANDRSDYLPKSR